MPRKAQTDDGDWRESLNRREGELAVHGSVLLVQSGDHVVQAESLSFSVAFLVQK